MIELARTPFTDCLLDRKSPEVISLHALPIHNGRSIKNSSLFHKYEQLYGKTYMESEITYTGNILDNPVKPQYSLRESEEITAKAFGSKKTFYTTMGTTLSNYIAVYGLVREEDRVLADKNCHQSIHFALKQNKNNVTYSEEKVNFEDSGRSIMNVEKFLYQYEQAYIQGNPYKLVILNGCSYEGIIYDIRGIIKACLEIHDEVHFLVDEAWFSYGYFHPFYKKYSAMSIANDLQIEYPDKNISVVSTQSAHKSLSSLRQASYIHVNSDNNSIRNISSAKYMLHTTSPSYPIISSLELCRAQMVLEGRQLIEKQLQNSKKVCEFLDRSNNIYLNKDNICSNWYIIDPTKLSINFSNKEGCLESIKDELLKRNLYINRKTKTSMLFNLHIGIGNPEIEQIISTLKEIDELESDMFDTSPINHLSEDKIGLSNTIADYYLIAYPPGRPLITPGDEINEHTREKIYELQATGVSLIKSLSH